MHKFFLISNNNFDKRLYTHIMLGNNFFSFSFSFENGMQRISIDCIQLSVKDLASTSLAAKMQSNLLFINLAVNKISKEN